jgi:hypothetical protein
MCLEGQPDTEFFWARYRIAAPTRAAAVKNTPMIVKRTFFLNFGSVPLLPSASISQNNNIQKVLAIWMTDYNAVRAHSTLGNLP